MSYVFTGNVVPPSPSLSPTVPTTTNVSTNIVQVLTQPAATTIDQKPATTTKLVVNGFNKLEKVRAPTTKAQKEQRRANGTRSNDTHCGSVG